MSPVYGYYHLDSEAAAACPAGAEFEFTQLAVDLPLTRCPWCGGGVERGLAPASIRTHKFDCELKDLGFSKLRRVDDGLFENLTQRPGEARLIDRRDPTTFPKGKK